MPTVSTVQQIGSVLALRRRHLKMSQATLAEKIGLSQNRLSVLEKNPATLNARQLLALVNALGLEMSLGERSARKTSAEW